MCVVSFHFVCCDWGIMYSVFLVDLLLGVGFVSLRGLLDDCDFVHGV